MTIQPVNSTPAPGYPDKSRWLAAPLAVGLTAAMALGLNACGERVSEGEPTAIPIETCTVQAESTTEYIIMGEELIPVPETSTTVNTGTADLPNDYVTPGIPVQIPAAEVEP